MHAQRSLRQWLVPRPGSRRPAGLAVAALAAVTAVALGIGLAAPRPAHRRPIDPLDYVVPAGWHTERITVAGRQRTYLLTDAADRGAADGPNAAATTGRPRPLLLLFHGLGQTTDAFVRDTAILTTANRAGVVAAAPISPDEAWNDGRMGLSGRDDDAYSLAIVNRLAAEGIIDPLRVTVAGFSNGAGMAMELAARHPDRVAALVSVDGELLAGRGQSHPRGRVPAFFIHGTNDPVQPLDGRASRGGLLVGQISEQQTIAMFRRADGDGNDAPSLQLVPRSRAAFVGPIEIYRWGDSDDAPVTYAKIDGMGHKWPMLACGDPLTSARIVDMTLPSLPAAACTPSGGPGTRLADLGADGLVIGVAATAHLQGPQT